MESRIAVSLGRRLEEETMFCPRCGTTQSVDLNFCKSCGANLAAIRQAVEAPAAEGEKFDWSRTWSAEMFMSNDERLTRKEQLERERGITPEIKRVMEVKAGVIVSSVGVAVTILLFMLMEGIVLGGKVTPQAAEILSRLWVAGLIPVFVGLAWMINGLVVSKKLVEIATRKSESDTPRLPVDQERPALRPADTNEFIPANLSVTDQTTRHLHDAEKRRSTTRD